MVFYAVKNGNQTGIVDSILFLKSIGDSYTALLPELSYDYDANGNIIRVYENDIQRVRYYYDGLNRLVREDNNYIDKTITYCYDKCGDILSKSEYALTSAETLGEPVNTVTYSYTDANFKNAVTQYGDDVIVYDVSGNPTSYRGYTMTWAKGRQLASLSGNGKSMSFKYDNAGIRTSKTVNGVETKYTYLGGTLVSQKTGDEVINFAYSAGGAPYGFSYNGQSYFYLLNLQGDVIGIYDGSGNVVVRYTYDSWGKVISVTGSLADTVGVKNPLRYRGYYYDVEMKLYYLQSRYYDPETCRFINADSLLVAGDDYIQGVNMFAYCQNNPVMYSDPSGRVLSSSQAVAIDITKIVVCLSYIAKYAELNNLDVNAVSDFLRRTTDDDTTLTELSELLTLGVYILAGEEWIDSLITIKGWKGDLGDIMKAASGGTVKIGIKSTVIGVAIDVIRDFYNPLLFDDDLRLRFPVHMANAAAGVGIGAFSVELAAAVAAATGGNILAGAAVGTLFYFIASFGWGSISK